MQWFMQKKKWCKCIITEVFINNSMQRFMQNGCVKDSMPQIFTKIKKKCFYKWFNTTIYIILIIKKNQHNYLCLNGFVKDSIGFFFKAWFLHDYVTMFIQTIQKFMHFADQTTLSKMHTPIFLKPMTSTCSTSKRNIYIRQIESKSH